MSSSCLVAKRIGGKRIGFTLIELLVIIAIIGALLAALRSAFAPGLQQQIVLTSSVFHQIGLSAKGRPTLDEVLAFSADLRTDTKECGTATSILLPSLASGDGSLDMDDFGILVTVAKDRGFLEPDTEPAYQPDFTKDVLQEFFQATPLNRMAIHQNILESTPFFPTKQAVLSNLLHNKKKGPEMAYRLVRNANDKGQLNDEDTKYCVGQLSLITPEIIPLPHP